MATIRHDIDVGRPVLQQQLPPAVMKIVLGRELARLHNVAGITQNWSVAVPVREVERFGVHLGGDQGQRKQRNHRKIAAKSPH